MVIGGFLTTAAAIITEYFRGRRESKLDRAKRDDDRSLARDTFQRETILRLQDALVDWTRVQAEHHIADTQSFRASGTWGKNLVGEEVSARELVVNRTLTLLRSRIDDDELRAAVELCQDIAFEAILAKSEVQAEEIEVRLAHALNRCLSMAGERARHLW